MELIKINDCKLKVMLSEIDLKCYNLDCDKLDYDCSATKQAFREMHALSAVYYFDDFASLAHACALLQQYGFKDRSALYSSNEGYYLAISEDYKQNNNTYSVNERGKGVPHYPILGEYGKRLRADKSLAFIKEHCLSVCSENAVERMSILK